MNKPDRIKNIRSKFEWTKHHVANLDREVQAFFASNPYEIRTKYDPNTRKITYYLARLGAVPASVSLIASDAFGGMISCLDHIIYQLFLAAGGDRDKATHLYFPIFSDFTEYKSSRQRKVKGLSGDAIHAIDLLEPYNGGAGHELWVLKELNNQSKHRELITAVSQCVKFDFGSEAGRRMSNYWREAFPDDPPDALPVLECYFRVGTGIEAVNVGDELFVLENVENEPNDKMKFVFQVSLFEPQIAKPQPIIEAVHQMASLVESAINVLEPFL